MRLRIEVMIDPRAPVAKVWSDLRAKALSIMPITDLQVELQLLVRANQSKLLYRKGRLRKKNVWPIPADRRLRRSPPQI